MGRLRNFINPYRKIDPVLLEKRKKSLQGFKARQDIARTPSERFADFLTNSFGTIWFLSFNAILFAIWLIWNNGVIPFLPLFDPYPYGMLTTLVSLEAIFLAIVVLISQNRAAKIADLREEVDLQVNTLAEQEVTKMINMIDEIHDHLGLPPEDDEELSKMKLRTNIYEIEESLRKEQWFLGKSMDEENSKTHKNSPDSGVQ